MPRSADPQPELALQGSLFGEPEPAEAAAEPASDAAGDLSDAALGADAAARPRRRRQPEPSAPSPDTAGTADENEEDDDDLPACAHHSQVAPQQLTPMLPQYAELKAAHPRRVLLV